MRCHTIPFRRLPHPSKLFLAYLEKFSSVAPFYAHPPKLPAVLRVARKLKFPAERRREVAGVLREQNAGFGCGAATQRQLEQLEKGAVAVVTGQQVGLFSGPAYAVYKALTAVAVAEELTRAGVRVVPVFWLATEDHDLDEVRSTHFFRLGHLVSFELPDASEAPRPVGRMALGAEVEALVRQAAEELEGPEAPRLAEILRACYQPGETYGSAFGKLFARLFEDQGLILLDPLDARLHRIAAPIYRRAVAESAALREKLLERGRELDRAGYAAQVKVTARSTLLFSLAGGQRRALTESGGKFLAGETPVSREELLQAADDGAETLSANALLRPVVQDFLLPTAAYIGGPGEIAYYAQAEVVYEHMLGRMPVILPRADFTLVDAKAGKLLKRYGFTLEDLWKGKQEVRRRMELRAVPPSLAKDFARSSKEVEQALKRLRRPLGKLDPTLEGALERARVAATFHLDKLQRKAGRARDVREGVLSAHSEYLHALLFPHKAPAARSLSFLPFLAKWGPEALNELKRLSGSKKLGAHQILFLD